MLVRGERGPLWFVPLLTTLGVFLGAASGRAETPQTSPPTATTPEAPVPYSLPWQLRPAAVANGLRLDTSIASWESSAGDGSTTVFGVIATRKVSRRMALLGRVSYVASRPPRPGTERSGNVLSNALLGATFLKSRPSGLRVGFFFATALPVGGGGGDSPDSGDAAGLTRAIATRSAMDNALFATNYFTLIGGATVAKVTRAATIQAEATVLQLFRARGPGSQDGARTNFTSGVHVGRSFNTRVSGGAELRYQRWLSDAAPARSNPAARETLTLAFGPRMHFRLAGNRWVRPGLSLTLPLDDPLGDQKYRVLQIDVPVSF